MAFDRQRAGLAILRVCVGVFFLFEGLGKIRWFTDTSILARQLNDWLVAVPPDSLSHAYLQRFAIPGGATFARLVPLGEMMSGLALVLGVRTPQFALAAFLMAFNFEFASGVIFTYGFLTNGYGLPVLGSTLALAFAGSAGNRATKRLAKPSRT